MGNKELAKSILFSLFFSISFVFQGQEILTDETKIIQGISKYRTELIIKNHTELKSLPSILDKFENLPVERNEQLGILYSIQFYSKYKKVVLRNLKRKLKAIDENIDFEDFISINEIELISRNPDLVDLIMSEILEKDFPYKLKNNQNLLKEIQFYDLQSGEKIVDIGAGTGTTGIVLGYIYDSLDIYMNELSIALVQLIEDKISRCTSLNSSNRFQIIKGAKQNTNLENLNLDKIILKNTFHHFTKKDKMLKSIQKSLKPDGVIYIYESLYRTEEDKKSCLKIMSEKNIIKFFSSYGFALVDSQYLHEGKIGMYKMKIDHGK